MLHAINFLHLIISAPQINSQETEQTTKPCEWVSPPLLVLSILRPVQKFDDLTEYPYPPDNSKLSETPQLIVRLQELIVRGACPRLRHSLKVHRVL
jgi:hypothetical protein